MLSKEVIEGASLMSDLSGELLVKSIKRVQTKQGSWGVFFDCVMEKGVTLPCKLWGVPNEDTAKEYDAFNGMVVSVLGTLKEYIGVSELHIVSIQVCNSVSRNLFFKTCNAGAIWGKFCVEAGWNNANTAGYMKVLSHFFATFPDAANRMQTSFAATGHHDAQIGGNLNHTVKILRIIRTLIQNDSRLAVYEDLLYLGAFFHDIGKIDEYDEDRRAKNSFLTHRYLGLKYIEDMHDFIVSVYSEEFYLRLISVIIEHHGEFGEPCRTIYSFIVHKADHLESLMTGLLEGIEDGKAYVSTGGDLTLKYDDKYLVI